MSVLASLARAYERLGVEVPPFGYSRTNVAFSIRIDKGGQPTCPPIDLRSPSGKKGNKLVGRRLELPTFLIQRTSGIEANFLWDKTEYSLGVLKPDSKKSAEKQAEDAVRTHKSFVDLHRQYLSAAADEGLTAFMRFLEKWTPDKFDGWPEDMKGENIVFELDGDRGQYIHERPAARELWLKVLADQPGSKAICLVSGVRSRTLRSHPPNGMDGSPFHPQAESLQLEGELS
jgi:CRISPR-associated protein Csd1